MITSIILILLIIGAIYLLHLKYTFFTDIFGIMISVICGAYLLIHLLTLSFKKRDYEIFVERRNSFEQTLEDSRQSGNPYEAAAIMKEVAEWNIKLSVHKYDSKHVYFSQYTDDRFNLLEPIK